MPWRARARVQAGVFVHPGPLSRVGGVARMAIAGDQTRGWSDATGRVAGSLGLSVRRGRVDPNGACLRSYSVSSRAVARRTPCSASVPKSGVIWANPGKSNGPERLARRTAGRLSYARFPAPRGAGGGGRGSIGQRQLSSEAGRKKAARRFAREHCGVEKVAHSTASIGVMGHGQDEAVIPPSFLA
jgi:hypothetical protein